MQLLSNDTTDVVCKHTDYGITNGNRVYCVDKLKPNL